MLFLHNGADDATIHAVYTGERPKDNEKSYYQVTRLNFARVLGNAKDVASRLDIPGTSGMWDVLLEWAQCTDHDATKKTIYEMMSLEGMAKRKETGDLANWRYYNNYIDLVLALYGEVLAQTNLRLENAVAAAILHSPFIRKLMRDNATAINKLAEEVFPSDRDKLLKGAYATLHPSLSWNQWTMSCTTMTTAELLPCLYDVTMSFKKPWGWTEPPMDGGKITKDNMRMNVSTPDEDFYWTSRGRWADVPMWAAPSYTAQLMLLVAAKAGVSTPVIQAFAYAIYAYWNQIYPLTATPVHRMYGVMTTAKEFGVDARACDPHSMYREAGIFIRSGNRIAKL